MRKGKIALIAGAAVGAILLVVATILLIKGVAGFRRSVTELGRQQSKLEKFYRLDIFPSEVNVRLEQSNVSLLDEKFEQLTSKLREGNVESGKISGPGFSRAVGLLKTRLTKLARQNRVSLPQGFSFGFDHYAGTGLLPKPAQAQRVATQLLMVNKLAQVLIESQITSLDEIKRDMFDKPGGSVAAEPAQMPGMLPGLPGGRTSSKYKTKKNSAKRTPKIEKLYEKERFDLVFHATEASLIKALNDLSASPMFCRVLEVRVSKKIEALEAPDPSGAGAAGALPGMSAVGGAGLSGLLGVVPGAAEEPEVAEDEEVKVRQVCGREVEVPMAVTLVVEVYNFVGEESGDSDE
jgi:hypothetical protein